MANSRQYTDEELIQRVWDVEEIKKLIHKRVIYIANEMRKEELIEVAERLLKLKKLSYEDIAEIAKLTVEEVKALDEKEIA